MKNVTQESRKSHYIHRMSYSTQERIVGLFVLFGIGMLLVMLFGATKTKDLFEERITLYGLLESAEGITKGTVVKLSGIQVGEVVSIDIAENNNIIATLEILSRFHSLLRKNSVAKVGRLSVLGRSSIEITAGSSEQPLINNGETLSIEASKSLDELIAQATPVLEKVLSTIERVSDIVAAVDPSKIELTVSSITKATENVALVTAKLESSEGFLGTLINDPNTSADLKSSATSLKQVLEGANLRLLELKPLIENTNSLSVKAGPILDELPGLFSEMRGALVQVKGLLGGLEQGPSQSSDLLLKVKMLVDDLDKTMKGIQRIWPISSAVGEEEIRDELIKPQGAHL